MHKRLIHIAFRSFIFGFFLFFQLASCTTSSNEKSNESKKTKSPPLVEIDLDDIQNRDTLIAIIDNSSTSYFIYKGRPMGFEYELLQLFCQEIGLHLKLELRKDLDEAFDLLQTGGGDLLAYNLSVTKERKEKVSFTRPHNQVRQVLIQKLPENWRQKTMDEVEKSLIRNPIDLIGKEVHVRKGSAHQSRLKNLAQEIGGDIVIIESPGETDFEELIEQVALGNIAYTVADEDLAMIAKSYFPEIDIQTAVSFPQQIAWATRKNSPQLLQELNGWIGKIKKKPEYYVIYNRYFKSYRPAVASSNYLVNHSRQGRISQYDDLFRRESRHLAWDWRLLAAQAYKESQFDANAESWAGALGLMQLLPETARQFGTEKPLHPAENVKASVRYLKWLDNYWTELVADEEERRKFVLASYNVGQGHVMDAYRLAEKYEQSAPSWTVVSDYLRKKSDPAFFTDPVVRYGYCRGSEPVNYVSDILTLYQNYQLLVKA